MKSASALIAGAVLMVASTAANAAFVVNTDRVVGTTNDVVRFFVLNNGTGSTGTTVKNINLTATASQPFVFQITDIDGDGANDANSLGSGLNSGSAAGSFMRVGAFSGFTPIYDVTGTNPDGRSDRDSDGTPDANPLPAFQNLLSFRVTGGLLSGNGVTATSGLGALVANLVVPTGSTVSLTGQVSSNVTGALPVAGVNAVVPEPASLGLAGIASLGLLARRRNAAK